MTMSPRVMLMIAIVSALLTASLAGLWFYRVGQQTRTEAFLRLRQDRTLPRGERITLDMVEPVALPVKERDGLGRFIPNTESERIALKDRRTAQHIGPGDFLLRQYFAEDPITEISRRIAPDKRAIAIPVNDAGSVSHFVQPNSIVDIYAVLASGTGGGGPPEAQATLLLESIRVIAVGKTIDRSPWVNTVERGYSTITIEVTPQQAAVAIAALPRARGGLTLALRNAGDAEPAR